MQRGGVAGHVGRWVSSLLEPPLPWPLSREGRGEGRAAVMAQTVGGRSSRSSGARPLAALMRASPRAVSASLRAVRWCLRTWLKGGTRRSHESSLSSRSPLAFAGRSRGVEDSRRRGSVPTAASPACARCICGRDNAGGLDTARPLSRTRATRCLRIRNRTTNPSWPGPPGCGAYPPVHGSLSTAHLWESVWTPVFVFRLDGIGLPYFRMMV